MESECHMYCQGIGNSSIQIKACAQADRQIMSSACVWAQTGLCGSHPTTIVQVCLMEHSDLAARHHQVFQTLRMMPLSACRER